MSRVLLWAAGMLLWAWLGYMTGKADSRHDQVGYGFGLAFIFLPLLAALIPVIGKEMAKRKWRREWERTHGKPWSESEAAKFERDRGA